ncbi:hypothetical protein Bra3105_14965 [Brachybacterium halotolerans subsp. kimchii]|uniref:hypothetical protein n=1 Tax=Brachybacterium halotolerans TaxID=2795215 RepID=UPI001E3F4D0E|nr:hypothetical protein [Brachybacterium halotolerans]UEJ82127.1 hypothetical protein Bra3105_14965 [Brachybacterium halotolerans subsp. kimchii]
MSQSPWDRPDPHRGPHPVIPGEVVHHHAPDAAQRSFDPYAADGQHVPGGPPPGSALQPYGAPTGNPGAGAAPMPGVMPVPVAVMPLKSVGVAFVLTFFFGVFGVFYSSVTGALVLIGITVGLLVLSTIVFGILSVLTMGIGAVLFGLVPLIGVGAWIASIIWGCTAASNHNQRVQAQYAQMAARHQHPTW